MGKTNDPTKFLKKSDPKFNHDTEFAIRPELILRQEYDPFRKLIREWLVSCRDQLELANRTLIDYQDKVFKFWWWSDGTGFAEKLGRHPKFVTTELASEFALYLKTPTQTRWGLPAKITKTSRLRLGSGVTP